MSQFTPGPWDVYRSPDKKDGEVFYVGSMTDVARISRHRTLGDTQNPSAEERANARLIAAAPDLLELCKRALTQSARVHPDFMRDLQDAIARAEGKS